MNPVSERRGFALRVFEECLCSRGAGADGRGRTRRAAKGGARRRGVATEEASKARRRMCAAGSSGMQEWCWGWAGERTGRTDCGESLPTHDAASARASAKPGGKTPAESDRTKVGETVYCSSPPPAPARDPCRTQIAPAPGCDTAHSRPSARVCSAAKSPPPPPANVTARRQIYLCRLLPLRALCDPQDVLPEQQCLLPPSQTRRAWPHS